MQLYWCQTGITAVILRQNPLPLFVALVNSNEYKLKSVLGYEISVVFPSLHTNYSITHKYKMDIRLYISYKPTGGLTLPQHFSIFQLIGLFLSLTFAAFSLNSPVSPYCKQLLLPPKTLVKSLFTPSPAFNSRTTKLVASW